jgi:hypothetical protein
MMYNAHLQAKLGIVGGGPMWNHNLVPQSKTSKFNYMWISPIIYVQGMCSMNEW